MTVRSRSAATALAGLAVTAIALTACGTGEQAAGGGDKIKVVASTSAWASVVQAIGGDDVDVEAIISDPNADPHSYESTPKDAAKVTDADLVVFNGGGYDGFMEKILGSSGQGKPVVEAVKDEHEGEPAGEHGGHEEHGHEGHDHSANEHVWYDLHVVQQVAADVSAELSKLQPAKAEQFGKAAGHFAEDIGKLQGRVGELGDQNRGKQVIVTEPVAHYLVEAASLQDITPPEFVKAVEAESDPSAAAVAAIQNAVNSKQAAAVIYNPQTESPVTRNVRSAAEQNQIPVVEMTETLPQGKTYVQWMDDQITALQAALTQNR
ncbi:zinc/manganese transport system substrate-binding protein [Saccharopolyspora shandongensis]|uniref:Zinc/manganese transport system substrate-binding protein n=1 Tax=Saccharopolyspora shandongensis TaxID=418495 RepID=A0A1H3IDE5_9PSEU|nr:zinc ABC transporter substrate-binding protein [Saccharopolyspora shandongensis]SDY25279.1 zinc/manganese transport system substrate-binding protein [Saccharopolyspora shandongensis]